MVDFWKTTDGDTAANTGNEYDSSGGYGEPIPNDTTCVAAIDEALWITYGDNTYINVRWSIFEPKEFANRKVFQKIKVYDADDKKADKAKRMLAAIDANAGGKLVKLGREPSDHDLMGALAGKIMRIKVMLWEIDGKSGNWVAMVGPRNSGNVSTITKKTVNAPADNAPAYTPADNEVPF